MCVKEEGLCVHTWTHHQGTKILTFMSPVEVFATRIKILIGKKFS